jgi:hypothetical protein
MKASTTHSLPSPSKLSSSPTKTSKRSRTASAAPSTTAILELATPEKKAAQALGVALRNLLKLPKAHKWVCFEFFYSNLDRVLFEGENDFAVCLRESFPQLKTRLLTRVEWCKVRRLMGKPRRCSQAFFAEERAELARRRQRIRTLQQRKQSELGEAVGVGLRDLPDSIPMQLTVGARVTARLRRPQDGLFTGRVDAYDTSNNTYRVTFDRVGLGTHSIPDDEVLSAEEPETVPLSSFSAAKARPRPQPPPQPFGGLSHHHQSQHVPGSPFKITPVKFGPACSPGLAGDPLLSGATPRGKVSIVFIH